MNVDFLFHAKHVGDGLVFIYARLEGKSECVAFESCDQDRDDMIRVPVSTIRMVSQYAEMLNQAFSDAGILDEEMMSDKAEV